VVGHLTLGGSLEPVQNPVALVELALEKGATLVLVPVSARRQLLDLSDDVATRIQVVYYLDAVDALRKGILG
jgi:ATP-dependent Lon protease